jgi:hypothetical protein
MANSRKEKTMSAATFHNNLATAAVAVFLVLFPMTFVTAAADAADALSDGDKQCLGCHSYDGLKKDLAGGKTLSLHIQGEAFAKSIHGVIGCAACHAEVDLKTHSQVKKNIASAREYSIAMTKVCSGCHAEALKHNEGSIHATLLGKGNLSAPVCTDCHGTHAISPKTAYDTCVGCHQTAMGAHQKWLPNAGLHLEVVSCAACHAPTAQRMVDLRLYDGVEKKWVAEKEGLPEFEKMARAADADGNGLDAQELRKLMGLINRDPAGPQRNLRGRIELRTGVEAHQLAGKSSAIKDCTSCHQQGAEPFQNVTVSIVSADGKPLRYKAQKEVLSSVLSVESLREFYAVGGTRNVLLDVLLILAVLAGVSVPIGHQILKRVVKKQMERDAQQGGPTKPNGHDHP